MKNDFASPVSDLFSGAWNWPYRQFRSGQEAIDLGCDALGAIILNSFVFLNGFLKKVAISWLRTPRILFDIFYQVDCDCRICRVYAGVGPVNKRLCTRHKRHQFAISPSPAWAQNHDLVFRPQSDECLFQWTWKWYRHTVPFCPTAQNISPCVLTLYRFPFSELIFQVLLMQRNTILLLLETAGIKKMGEKVNSLWKCEKRKTLVIFPWNFLDLFSAVSYFSSYLNLSPLYAILARYRCIARSNCSESLAICKLWAMLCRIAWDQCAKLRLENDSFSERRGLNSAQGRHEWNSSMIEIEDFTKYFNLWCCSSMFYIIAFPYGFCFVFLSLFFVFSFLFLSLVFFSPQ